MIEREKSPIFTVRRSNPTDIGSIDLGQLTHARQVLYFAELFDHLPEIVKDEEIKAIQILDSVSGMYVRPFVPDIHFETNLAQIHRAGLSIEAIGFLNGQEIDDVVDRYIPEDKQTVGVIKFVA